MGRESSSAALSEKTVRALLVWEGEGEGEGQTSRPPDAGRRWVLTDVHQGLPGPVP